MTARHKIGKVDNIEKDNNQNTPEQGLLAELPKAETREQKFIRNLFICSSIQEAGLKAGYSENTSKSTLYVKIRSPRFQQKVRDFVIANDLMTLPRIAKIEDKVLQHLEKHPLDLPKYKDTVRQKKQVAGLLNTDSQPSQPMANIKNIQQLMIQINNQKSQDLGKKIQDEKFT